MDRQEHRIEGRLAAIFAADVRTVLVNVVERESDHAIG
jgi:hypothetical protein